MSLVQSQSESLNHIFKLVGRCLTNEVAKLALVHGFYMPGGCPGVGCRYEHMLPAELAARHGGRRRNRDRHTVPAVEFVVADDQGGSASRKFGPDIGAKIIPVNVALVGPQASRNMVTRR